MAPMYGASTPKITARADSISVGAGVVPPAIWAILVQLVTSLLGGLCPTPQAKAKYVAGHPRVVEAGVARAVRREGYRGKQATHLNAAILDDLHHKPLTEDEVSAFDEEVQT